MNTKKCLKIRKSNPRKETSISKAYREKHRDVSVTLLIIVLNVERRKAWQKKTGLLTNKEEYKKQ